MWQRMTYGPKPKTVTKRELASQLALSVGVSKRQARHIVSLVFQIMSSSMARGQEVEIPGLGILSIKDSPQQKRLWRLDKLVIQFKDKKRIVFKPRKDW